MTVKVARGRLGLNSLSMNRPYSDWIVMWSVASGAAAYSQGTLPPAASPHEAGAGLVSGFLVSVTATVWHRAHLTGRRRSATLGVTHGTRAEATKATHGLHPAVHD